MRVFLYGTLRDEALRRTVLGAEVEVRSAALLGVGVRSARDGDRPTLVAAPGERAEGLLTGPLPDDAIARFDWYERAFGYAAETVEIDGTAARFYRGHDDPSAAPWCLEAWQADWAELSRIAASETMSHFPARSPDWIAARWTQIHQRAASAARARHAAAPMDLRRGLDGDDVEVAEARRPYTDYFSLIEHDLRFRRYDGTMSPVVSRAALVGGDAVTVLPYDPAFDAVLLVEQFRFGPWARGDLRPWTLEPIAGRIDAGETPEETAIRESREEAHLDIDRLEKVAAYYSSTGAYSEYVWSYVGLCDLSGYGGNVAGEETEDEDILSHVVPFDRLMKLVGTGEAENAQLLVSALWLASQRDRLRAG